MLLPGYPTHRFPDQFVETTARTARAPERIEANHEAPEHERFLWDIGFHWGEWLEPGVEIALFEGEHSIVATAHSARLLAKTAEVLGRTEDAARWTELAANVERAWAKGFIGADGRLVRDSQATNVRALRFGLIPEHLVPSAVEHLVEQIRADGTHLSTGFLSTEMLLPVLADNRHADVAFDLLFQDTSPSWLTMIDRGATTVWEHWDGIDAKGTPSGSLNHYSKGAVVGFLHRYVADLRPLESHPGYERSVEPVIDDRLDWARATLETPFGLASSSWRREAGAIRYEVVVPADTECESRVSEPVVLGSGTYVITFWPAVSSMTAGPRCGLRIASRPAAAPQPVGRPLPPTGRRGHTRPLQLRRSPRRTTADRATNHSGQRTWTRGR